VLEIETECVKLFVYSLLVQFVRVCLCESFRFRGIINLIFKLTGTECRMRSFLGVVVGFLAYMQGGRGLVGIRIGTNVSLALATRRLTGLSFWQSREPLCGMTRVRRNF
jgi:hypothetical protein